MQVKFTKDDILKRAVEEIIEEKSFKQRLNSGKKLRIKLGIDPTGPYLHLGHTVTFWKLRQFQELGHTAVLIIGDYTASIGDPSGRDKTRPSLSDEEIKRNYKTYEKQSLKILSYKNLEVHKQTEWFNKVSLKDLIKLMAQVSVGKLLSHETFRERIKSDQQFFSHELLYPFLQGYDSVAVEADIEIGASEQKFNLLMGRALQRHYHQKPQDILTMPYLLGTDGKLKMSKSFNNYIALNDKPDEMFGKVMSIHDDEVLQYYESAAPVSYKEIEKLRKEKIEGRRARDLKFNLAKIITEIYWGKNKSQEVASNFEKVFKQHELPKNIKTVKHKTPINPVELLYDVRLAKSKSEARRQIAQRSVRKNNELIIDENQTIEDKDKFTLSAGKRNIIWVDPSR